MLSKSLQIIIILGTLVTCIAAIPLDEDHQPDKNSENSSYQYGYTVDDGSGRSQGKVETRSGELASGRYFINGDQSSTEVKYFADEWGYHPWVKHRTSNERNTANAHSALDNYEAQMLINNTGIEKVDESAEPIQNSATQAIIPISQIENANKELPSIMNLPSKTEALEFSDGLEFLHEEIDNQDQLQTVIKSTNINDSTQYSETLTNAIGTTNQINGISSTDLEELLLNENAGDFGQRVTKNTNDPNTIQELNNNDEDSVGSSQTFFYVSQKRDSNINQKSKPGTKASSYNYKSALANFQTNLELIQKTKDDVNKSLEIREVTPMQQHSIIKNDQNEGIQSADELDKKYLKALSAGSKSTKFSKPIVVIDSFDTERFEYSTTLPCNEENTDSISLVGAAGQGILEGVTHSLATIPQVENRDRITISSAVLNPIQAGVALVDAGKTHLIGAEASLTEAVNESGFDYSLDGSQALKQIGVAKTSVESTNEGVNPVVGGDKLEKLTSVMPTSVTDQGIEIQKSLEVYHSAPVREIHYPAQIASQVTSIDQQVEAYLTTQKHENAKQVPFNNENLQLPTQIDLANSNSNNFEYISIENQPLMLLQEYQTIPGGNDPSYVSDVEQKVNVNNLTLENFKRLVQNYVAHGDTQRTKVTQENLTENENFSSKSRINGQIASPELGKLSNAFIMGQRNRVNDKSISQKVEAFTGQVQSQTQSNLPRLPSEFTNVAQHLEADRLNYRDENQYHRQTNINEFEIGSKLNYPKSDINLTRQQIPIYTDELYAESTKIIDNVIPVINVQSTLKSISNEKNNAYMYTPNTHGLRAEINSYDPSINGNNLVKTPNLSTLQLSTYPMDKFPENVLEKPLTSYPMHEDKHVPVLQAYPVTVKKIIEKKVPYPIQKLSSQPYPFHILQSYPKEKFIEKPIHIPLEQKVQIPVPYPLEIPVKIPYPAGLPTYPEKSVHMPYGVRYGVAYQQIMHPTHTLYGRFDTNSADQNNNNNNNNHNNDNNNYNNNNNKYNDSINNNNNFEQNSKRYLFDNSVMSMATLRPGSNNRHVPLNQFSIGKQIVLNHYIQPKKSHMNQLSFMTHSKMIDQPTSLRWHVMHPNSEKQKYKNVEIVRSVPLLQHALNPHQQNQVPHPAHQETLRHTESVSSFRRVRKPEVHFYSQTGNFRQSKMEYGFKPPIIPSVQYDEETAMKIEN